MTALVSDFNGPWDNGQPLPARIEGLPVKAGQKLYGGGMVVLRPSNGFVYSAANAVLGDIALGRADAQYDNTNGTDGAITARVFFGCFGYFNSAGGDKIATANTGQPCYIVDDCTLALTAGGGSRVLAGPIVHVDSVSGLVFAEINPVTNGLANFAGGGEDIAQPEAFHTVRGVVTVNVSNLAQFASVTGGTIQDGVTYAQGDRVLLIAQTTASQNGIWVVGAVAAGVAPLTRPADFSSGSTVPAETYVSVSEGTIHQHSLYRLNSTGSAQVIDTSSITFAMVQDAAQEVFRARCVAAANVTISSALVAGQTVDGVTLAVGDRVLLVNQTTATQNGLYLVPPSGTAVYAPEWATGQIKASCVVQISEGTSWSNSEWKATAAQSSTGGFIPAGTDPVFYPKIFLASHALSSGAFTDSTNPWVLSATKSVPIGVDQTAAAAVKVVLSAGKPGTGSIALTGTTSDTIVYGCINW